MSLQLQTRYALSLAEPIWQVSPDLAEPMVKAQVDDPRFVSIVVTENSAQQAFVEFHRGTPDDAIALIERLYDKQGDFGVFLQQVHNWADFDATKRSYELYQRYVMPHFSGDNGPRVDSFNWCSDNRDLLSEKRSSAARKMFDKHEAEQKAKAAAEMVRPQKGREAW